MTSTNEVTAREARYEEHPQALAITNAIFPPIPLERWREDPKRTANVGFLGDEMVGAISLHPRRFRLVPGVVVDAAFEHDVGVKEEYRGRGVGMAMIKAATEFLRDRCDFLMVWRSGEASPAYRFYNERTYHTVLNYCIAARLKGPLPAGIEATGVSEIPVEEMFAREEEFLAVFHACYSELGGFMEREKGYYRRQSRDVTWVCIPTAFRLLISERGRALAGYALLVDQTIDGKPRDEVSVADFAVRDRADEETAVRLIAAAAAIAQQQSRILRWTRDAQGPWISLLRRLGFETPRRYMALMGICLRPANVFAKFLVHARDCGAVKALPLNVWVWTVRRGRVPLHDAGTTAPEVTLEMTEHTLARLMAGRLHFANAVEEQLITLSADGAEAALELLEPVFPYARWDYHHFEYT